MPLHFAIEKKNVNIVNALLSNDKCDVNIIEIFNNIYILIKLKKEILYEIQNYCW